MTQERSDRWLTVTQMADAILSDPEIVAREVKIVATEINGPQDFMVYLLLRLGTLNEDEYDKLRATAHIHDCRVQILDPDDRNRESAQIRVWPNR